MPRGIRKAKAVEGATPEAIATLQKMVADLQKVVAASVTAKVEATPVPTPTAARVEAKAKRERRRGSYREIAKREDRIASFIDALKGAGVTREVRDLKAYRRIDLLNGPAVSIRGRHLLFMRHNLAPTDPRVHQLSDADSKYYMSAVAYMNVDDIRDEGDAKTLAATVAQRVRQLPQRTAKGA